MTDNRVVYGGGAAEISCSVAVAKAADQVCLGLRPFSYICSEDVTRLRFIVMCPADVDPIYRAIRHARVRLGPRRDSASFG